MGKLNPIQQADYIDKEYRDYLGSSFKFGNENYQKMFAEALKSENLYKGPYLDMSLSFKKGRSITELQEAGIICKSFSKLNNIPFNRPLYLHQERSLMKIKEKRNVVITTGTGSGKTECFLFPIFNEILEDIEKGITGPGIRAIMLYPMNALVNDQMDRVREILRNCPDITFGFFTGDTPNTVPKNYREQEAETRGYSLPPNELVSREEIRNNPPHILFTNYSMLEYLLIRPYDHVLIRPENLQHWKFVVLDEAHTYKGALGIEISMLLRRLTGFAVNKPRFILTSATLGEQNESEDEIVQFAEKLTSSTYDVSDIIFSERDPIALNLSKYAIDGEDYTLIKNNIKNRDIVKTICEKYLDKIDETLSIEEMVYQLLEKDEHLIYIYSILKDGSKLFADVAELMLVRMKQEHLISFIDLINLAEAKGKKFFELKYHSFVRALSGVYMTLGDSIQLSLKKTNYIKDKKAFEIGNCRYCNSSYIVGAIRYNPEDRLNYLVQNDEIDIYENYGDTLSKSVDYFLLENTINPDEIDDVRLSEYRLCTKCGSIIGADVVRGETCTCGQEHQIKVYKVENKNKKAKFMNNIGKCPCCGHGSQSGVVKTLNLGKDEGTALIGQILYESIDDNEEVKVKKGKLKLKKVVTSTTEEKKAKQFLTFSDSRQQASFSAAFFDANHTRMLQKRLLWKALEDNNHQPLGVDYLASYLVGLIKERDLFQNKLNETRNAWTSILVELLQIDGDYGGQGLGLFHFELDLDAIMSEFTDEEIEEELASYSLNKKDFETLIQLAFSVFRTTPAIKYIKSTLSEEDKLEFLEYRRFNNYVAKKNIERFKDVKNFIPANKNVSNTLLKFVMKACNCDRDEATELLGIIFDQIGKAGDLFTKHETRDIYQIDASKYRLKSYKNTKYYRCNSCGRVTPFNVHDKCFHEDCDGELIEINPDEVFKNNYYRKKYMNKKIEKIVIREHTAQLERKVAKKYQKDFKDKNINILSCSTTFEMGVDIGDLETVYMRNVPPTPANYVQRAGRAGRRKDSSAFVITYCSIGSHDYTYYNEPKKMISGKIKPPYFDTTNEKIVLRHLLAAALGYFFRAYPEYYKNIENLVFKDGVEAFREYLSDRPRSLGSYIDNKILTADIHDLYCDYKWVNKVEEKGLINNFVENYVNVVKEYEEALQSATAIEDYKSADFFQRQIKKVKEKEVLESLTKQGVIPKYGFPVDLVELQVYKNGVYEEKYDLTRDLRIAISEYAPDSEIVVDKEKFTSKYITLPKVDEFEKYYYKICPSCHKINISRTPLGDKTCKYCQTELEGREQYYIEPVHGFKTGETKESTRMKPKRSYAGEVMRKGLSTNRSEAIDRIEFTDLLSLEIYSNDELLVLNKSDFYYCPKCGYSEINDKFAVVPVKTVPHKNFRGYSCEEETLHLISLGHAFKTDVASFKIKNLLTAERTSYQKALSFLYAFLEGISIAFNIERNDINGFVDANDGIYEVLVFDNVPGGAGHVKRIMNVDGIKNALRAAKTKVSQECCDEETSCYNCLRNYYNQTHHNILKRKYAFEVIERLLESFEILNNLE